MLKSIGINNVDLGHNYTFPGFISIALSEMNRNSFFNTGLLVGLTHEPHVLSFLIFPSLFLILSYNSISYTIKAIVFFLYLFVSFLSSSTTNLLTLATLLPVYLILAVKFHKNYINLFLIFILALILYISPIFDFIYDEIVVPKLTTNLGSLDYSVSMLKLVTASKSFFGNGNSVAISDVLDNQGNMGYITSIFDIVFYIAFLYTAFKYTIDNSSNFILGFSFLYFILHSLKINYLIFNYPFLIYMLVLFKFFEFTSQNGPKKI
jgi:hypothetical protein